jgi:hypothetical protein
MTLTWRLYSNRQWIYTVDTPCVRTGTALETIVIFKGLNASVRGTSTVRSPKTPPLPDAGQVQWPLRPDRLVCLFEDSLLKNIDGL